jgi:hypothetical protein
MGYVLMPESGPHGGAVGPADGLPIAAGRRRVLGGQLFVEVHAETGGLVDIQVAFLEGGRAGEDLAGPLVEGDTLLNAEVPDGQVQVGVGRMAARRCGR